MAETRSVRMKVVLTLAERDEQAAAKRVEECRALIAAEEQQLVQLEEYTAHYLTTYQERAQTLDAHQMSNYSVFIQRLGEATSDQKDKLQRMHQITEQALSKWREKYLKRDSIANLIKRLELEENALLEKKLQKEMDEFATQQFVRRP